MAWQLNDFQYALKAMTDTVAFWARGSAGQQSDSFLMFFVWSWSSLIDLASQCQLVPAPSLQCMCEILQIDQQIDLA